MVTQRQRAAARKNIRKAASAATSKRTISSMPAATRSALGRQGAAVARRKRTGGSTPKTRQELYDEARRLGIDGRSKMNRAQLQRALARAR